MKKRTMLLLALGLLLSSLSHAQNTNALATFQEGQIYAENQQYEYAISCYKEAAGLGLPEAEYEVGLFYYQGLGVLKNTKTAVKWWTKAAEKGYAEAQYAVGDCHYNGEGVKEDKAKAIEWWTKASDQGHILAQ
jgi:TPR repeat protein